MASNSSEVMSLEERVKRLEAAKNSVNLIEFALLGFVLAYAGVRLTGVFAPTSRKMVLDVHHHHDRPTE